MDKPTKFHCALCEAPLDSDNPVDIGSVRPSIRQYLESKKAGLCNEDHVCRPCLDSARLDNVKALLLEDETALTDLEKSVLESLGERTLISADSLDEDEPEGLGARIADKVAAFGGSWTFILTFAGILFVWIVVNTIMAVKAFDPYPFILLNLVLSTLAALQAPVIMMSQNRQEEKDRKRAENDYKVNLKAELELRFVHEKLDHLLYHQMQNLLEIQDIQLDALRRMSGEGGGSGTSKN